MCSGLGEGLLGQRVASVAGTWWLLTGHDGMGSLTGQQLLLIIRLMTPCAVLSVGGCLFIFITAFLLRKEPSFRRSLSEMRMVLGLAAADMLQALSQLLSWLSIVHGNRIACDMQAFGLEYFDLVVFAWTSVFAFHLLWRLDSTSPVVDVDGTLTRREAMYHLFAWTVPALFTLIPVAGQKLGPSGAWCWIVADGTETLIYRGVAFYFPLIAQQTFNVACYIAIVRRIRSRALQMDAQLRRAVRLIIVYPIMGLLVWSIALANRIQEFEDPGNPIFLLMLLQGCLVSLQGLFNSVIYGWSSRLRKQFREARASRVARKIVQSPGIEMKKIPLLV